MSQTSLELSHTQDGKTQSTVQFLTSSEVAEILRVSIITIYRLVERRELSAHHIGRALRFRQSEVEKYVAQSRNVS